MNRRDLRALLPALWLLSAAAAAREPEPRVLEAHHLPIAAIRAEAASARPRLGVRLTVVVLEGSGWDFRVVQEAVLEGAALLEQCGVRLADGELWRVAVAEPWLDFSTPRSRRLAASLAAPRPALFFVRNTLQPVPFDAEAIGRSNSGTRPELRDSVWVAAGTRDLPRVVAHELVHVLSDSGEHSDAPGNLMAEQTAPDRVSLNVAQCGRLRSAGESNGLLRPSTEH